MIVVTFSYIDCMDRQDRIPVVVYRVAGRYRSTQECVFEDFCDLKTAQAEVRQRNSEFSAHIEYYIDAIRLDQLPQSQWADLLDRKLITPEQVDRVLLKAGKHC